MASRRSQTRRTQERLRSAEDKLSGEQEDVLELERELADDLEAIWSKWRDAAGAVEEVKVGLEKNDIHVSDLQLFWAARTTSP